MKAPFLKYLGFVYENKRVAEISMTSRYPIQNPRPNRKDILPQIITSDELCHDIWDSNNGYPRGAIGNALENELGKNHPAIDTLVLIVEKIAESIKNREYSIGGHTYPITVGHSPLTNSISPDTRDLARKLDLIQRPKCYGNNKQTARREQIARTSYWDLGPGSKHFLDLQSIRGLGDGYVYQSSDRNESIAHAAGIEFEKSRLNAQEGVQAESFVRLPKHVYDDEYTNNVYDVVAFETSNNTVVETVEVEIQTNNAQHIADDAEKLANAPGRSVWSVPNKASANQMLRAMVREGILTPAASDPGFPHGLRISLGNDRIKQLLLNNKYRQLGKEFPIIEVRSFNQTRNKVQNIVPDKVSVQAIEYGGEE